MNLKDLYQVQEIQLVNNLVNPIDGTFEFKGGQWHQIQGYVP